MDTVARLSYALDEFAGICAAGLLTAPSIETVASDSSITAKVSGSIWWDGVEYPFSLWVGDREGTPGQEDDTQMWLRFGEETVETSKLSDEEVFRAAPADALPDIVGGIFQATRMLDTAMEALACAETVYDFDATLEQLQLIAGRSKSADSYERDTVMAKTDLMIECLIDLMGNLTVSESEDCHLALDLSADTIDPVNGEKTRVRVGWIPVDDVSHDYTHAFELGEAKCRAHDDADLDRMLATRPEAAREHYRHTFTHMHQAAHAVGDYTAGKVGMALAQESTVDDPLLHVERHEVTHHVHAEVVEELNALLAKLSGEPGRGDEHGDHQHQH